MYKCEYTDIPYKGVCPIKDCIANIGQKHPSGCFHNMFQKTGELELSRVLDIRYLETQKQTLLSLASLYYWHSKCIVDPFCINCGMVNTKLCENEELCDKRKFFAYNIIKKYPWNLLKTGPEHLWALCNIRSRIRLSNIIFRKVINLDIKDYKRLIEFYTEGKTVIE